MDEHIDAAQATVWTNHHQILLSTQFSKVVQLCPKSRTSLLNSAQHVKQNPRISRFRQQHTLHIQQLELDSNMLDFSLEVFI